MPREGAIIFRDIVGKLDVLTVYYSAAAAPVRPGDQGVRNRM
jgi:hypothetical protein